MDAARTKSRPRRSMRVATIFTGVAACTFGATQVANAQDAARVERAVPDHKLYGSIRYAYLCGARDSDRTWLHYGTYDSTYAPDVSWCFGYKGLSESPPGVGIYSECGGNNHGFLAGITATGAEWSTSFGPGTTYRKLDKAHLIDVLITSWSGNDKCGSAPILPPR
jgi:hypothetical protein